MTMEEIAIIDAEIMKDIDKILSEEDEIL